ncbi:MAG: hypothetical protein WCR46_14380 [Deltaproteobacteria bacterium]
MQEHRKFKHGCNPAGTLPATLFSHFNVTDKNGVVSDTAQLT